MTKKHTKGRGTNPISRSNLKAPVRQWWVYSKGGGIGWSREFGPYFQGQAVAIAARLEARNSTELKPMFTASTRL